MIAIMITLTWTTFKWAGIILFVLSTIALFAGTVPANEERPLGDAMRWIVWPCFIVWFIVFVIRGMWV